MNEQVTANMISDNRQKYKEKVKAQVQAWTFIDDAMYGTTETLPSDVVDKIVDFVDEQVVDALEFSKQVFIEHLAGLTESKVGNR